MRRQLEYVPLDSLVPAETNDKDHAKAVIEASVRRFGFVDPFVIDERTGRLISGHGRREELLRARAAGDPAPAGVTIRAGEWHVPVERGWASDDDEHAIGAGISVNRTGELGGYDAETLDTILDSWRRRGEDLLAAGYTPGEYDDLRAWIEEKRADIPAATPAGPLAAVRSIMLDYPIVEFEEMATELRQLREARGIDSNAELVRTLVLEADRA